MTPAKALAATRKAAVSVVGVVALVVASSVLHGTAEAWAEGVLALGTALGVYRVPNDDVEGSK